MKIGLREAEISKVLRYTAHDCSVKAAIFQNGDQTVNFSTKSIRSQIKIFLLGVRCTKPDENRTTRS